MAGAGAGAAIGSVIPGLGTAVGGVLGGIGGGLYGHLYGSGDYTLKTNSLINDGSFSGVGSDYVRIRNSEPLGPISITSGQEVLKTFDLNPGNQITFPWLSNIARCYEQYIPHGIVFEFRTTASQAVTTGTSLGTLTIATEYDVYDRTYRNVNQMLEAAYSQQSGVQTSALHGIECDPRHNPLGMFYILHAGSNIGGSLREYTLGATTIATSGGTSSGEVGQLWIHYDISMCKTQSPSNTGMVDRWVATTFSNAAPFGSAMTRGATNIPGAITNQVSIQGDPAGYTTNTAYFFPRAAAQPGRVYLFLCRWQGTSVALTYPTWAVSGCEILNDSVTADDDFEGRLWTTLVTGWEGQFPQNGYSVTSGGVFTGLLVRITSTTNTASISISGTPTLPTGPTSVNIVCFEITGMETLI